MRRAKARLAGLALAATTGVGAALWAKGGGEAFDAVAGARTATVILGGADGPRGPTRHAMLKVQTAMSAGTVVRIAVPGRLVMESASGITRADLEAVLDTFGADTTIVAGTVSETDPP